MPKIKLLEDSEVVALLNKHVGRAQTQAQKDAMRRHKNVVRAVKETVTNSGLDRKVQKPLLTALLEAMSAEAPVAPAEQALAAE